MEGENLIITAPPEVEVHTAEEAARPQIYRAMSPIEQIVSGGLDGRRITDCQGRLPSLLIALSKAMKLMTKDKLAPNEKRRAFELLEQITTDDIRKACEESQERSVQSIMAFEDHSHVKVPPPTIAHDATDVISINASKDFQSRTGNGFFGGMNKGNMRIKDLLSAVSEVTKLYRLSEVAAKQLIRRCLRDRAREFFEHLCQSGADLKTLYTSLQDHYHAGMGSSEASQRLRMLLSEPIKNLDEFLENLLNLSISSVKDLPAKDQTKTGFLIACNHLTGFIHRHYPAVSALLRSQISQLRSTKGGQDGSEAFLTMMRVLRMHRDILESGSRKTNRVNEIVEEWKAESNTDIPFCRPVVGQEQGKAPSSQEIREILRDEIRQIGGSINLTKANTDVRHMVQEVVQEMANQSGPGAICQGPGEQGYGPAEHYFVPPEVIQENIAAWARGMAMPTRPPAAGPPWVKGPPVGAGQGNVRSWLGQANQGVNNQNRPPQFASGMAATAARNPNLVPLGGRPQNPVGLGQPNGGQQEGRRNFLPEEVYAKHFSTGNCFLCALPNHSFRACPVFTNGRITTTACPTCGNNGIQAYHNDCQGRNVKAHQNVRQGRDPRTGLGETNQVNEVSNTLSEDYVLDPTQIPVYTPEGDNMPKNL